MDHTTPRISPLGESAVVVEFGRVISEDLNRKATGLARYLAEDPFQGFVEAVPAYASTTVFFDPEIVRGRKDRGDAVLDTVAAEIASALERLTLTDTEPGSVIEIPANFDAVCGPDLGLVAAESGMPIERVVELFVSTVYRVFMIGFLPGFAYMGEVDESIALTRKQQPRQSVPKGSIGIAGRQTGIYPLESPGGWQLIGRTHVELFTPDGDRPTLLKPGDLVRFVPV